MSMSLPEFRVRFRSGLLELLWKQWTTLGVSGSSATESTVLLDPEALLLLSTEVARLDPRLFDEVLDWLQNHGDAINLQRVTRLQKEFGLGNRRVLAAIATRLARQSAHHKWKAKAQAGASAAVEPLFPGEGNFGEPDADFLAHGWTRGPVECRGLGVRPDVRQAANLMIKLRGLFGLQSRAEVFAWLLTHESGHPARIARHCGYFRRSVQLTLNELEHSGHVRSFRRSREKHFAINHADWRFLITWELPAGFPRWLHWAAVFALLQAVHRHLDDRSLDDRSADLQTIEWRKHVDFGLLADSGLPFSLSTPIEPGGAAAREAYVERVMSILREVGVS